MADPRIIMAIARLPSRFGMRGFPKEIFRISPDASFVSEDHVMLYTQRQVTMKNAKKDFDPPAADWVDFCKGTEEEIRREITAA